MKKQVLLAVTGLSPQIVTETIYAFAQQQQYITEIHIITTLEGRKRALKGLIEDQQLNALVKEYNLPDIQFNEQHIHCIKNKDRELNDALTVEDHNAIADFITNKVRELTQRDDAIIHASIAGGRKTMTFYLGYAMSLFGRDEDTISHVLVSEGYESLPDFYFPTLKTKILTGRTGPLDASKATITLANIPYVKMRKEMPAQLLEHDNVTFTTTVERLNTTKTKIKLSIDLSNLTLEINNKTIKLTPDSMTAYYWFLTETHKNKQGIQNPSNLSEKLCKEYSRSYLKCALLANCDVTVFNALGVTYKEDFSDDPETIDVKPMDNAKFERAKTNINNKLKKEFGEYIANLIKVKRLSPKGEKPQRFGIDLSPQQIIIKQ
jgi:CRISPR-associated protein (TIGR02584 family)